MKTRKALLLSVALGLSLSTSQVAQAGSQAGGVPTLDAEVSALETAVAAQGAAGATLEGQVATLQSQVAALQSQPGPSVYTNYGVPVLISHGDTGTVSSVTLPVGHYTLSGSIFINPGGEDTRVQCSYVSADTVNQLMPSASCPICGAGVAGADMFGMPVIGDVTITDASTSVFLRCHNFGHDVFAQSAMIVTTVGTITPSE